MRSVRDPVWPNEIESTLYQHPAVLEACVIGAKDAYRGETVKALVVLRPEWRGRGIATKLLQLLIEYAREHRCDRVALHFHPQGQSIYAKVGFTLIETEMRLNLVK